MASTGSGSLDLFEPSEREISIRRRRDLGTSDRECCSAAEPQSHRANGVSEMAGGDLMVLWALIQVPGF